MCSISEILLSFTLVICLLTTLIILAYVERHAVLETIDNLLEYISDIYESFKQ